jgi:hypothetical protein
VKVVLHGHRHCLRLMMAPPPATPGHQGRSDSLGHCSQLSTLTNCKHTSGWILPHEPQLGIVRQLQGAAHPCRSVLAPVLTIATFLTEPSPFLLHHHDHSLCSLTMASFSHSSASPSHCSPWSKHSFYFCSGIPAGLTSGHFLISFCFQWHIPPQIQSCFCSDLTDVKREMQGPLWNMRWTQSQLLVSMRPERMQKPRVRGSGFSAPAYTDLWKRCLLSQRERQTSPKKKHLYKSLLDASCSPSHKDCFLCFCFSSWEKVRTIVSVTAIEVEYDIDKGRTIMQQRVKIQSLCQGSTGPWHSVPTTALEAPPSSLGDPQVSSSYFTSTHSEME